LHLTKGIQEYQIMVAKLDKKPGILEDKAVVRRKGLKNHRLITPKGEVTIVPFCTPGIIGSFTLSQNRAKSAQYKPLISDKATLIRAAFEPEANVTLAITKDRNIVGLGILESPSPEERWVKLGKNLMKEVSVIEVTGPWRGMGLSGAILNLLVDHPLKEDRILFMVGYSWTWDLVGKGLTPREYREMLIGLFSQQGFVGFQTNEPNVMLRPENLFMARVGKHVSHKSRTRFDLSRYNVFPAD
jgi:acetoin utilization protein AcuA